MDRLFNKMDSMGIVKDRDPIKREFSSSAQVLQTVNERLMKRPTLAEVEKKKFSTDVEAKKKFQSAHASAM